MPVHLHQQYQSGRDNQRNCRRHGETLYNFVCNHVTTIRSARETVRPIRITRETAENAFNKCLQENEGGGRIEGQDCVQDWKEVRSTDQD